MDSFPKRFGPHTQFLQFGASPPKNWALVSQRRQHYQQTPGGSFSRQKEPFHKLNEPPPSPNQHRQHPHPALPASRQPQRIKSLLGLTKSHDVATLQANNEPTKHCESELLGQARLPVQLSFTQRFHLCRTLARRVRLRSERARLRSGCT